MKTKEELNALKEEVETLNKKLHELTDEELAQVSGGLCMSLANSVDETTVDETTVDETTVDENPVVVPPVLRSTWY